MIWVKNHTTSRTSKVSPMTFLPTCILICSLEGEGKGYNLQVAHGNCAWENATHVTNLSRVYQMLCQGIK